MPEVCISANVLIIGRHKEFYYFCKVNKNVLDTVIEVNNLSKEYRIGLVGTNSIIYDLQRYWAKLLGKEDPSLKIGQSNVLSHKLKEKENKYIWALKDISFQVGQGEVLGIIGKNGAGKSTLLKILSKVTSPSVGNIKIKGRIASLLEIGTGFHEELTGRENIFLNGAILGMTKNEIKRKFDEITDFSGIERYIDTPVKRYSSGMYVRLAFAVAAHLEPEILIIDEVLAVGDAEFQKKCLGKMKDVSSQGRTVLFVSHNMPAIVELCSRGMMLKEGSLVKIGNTREVVKNYIETNRAENNANDLSRVRNREGNGKIRFTSCKILDDTNKEIENIKSGQGVTFLCSFDVNYQDVLPPLHFSIKVVDDIDNPLFHMSNSVANGEEYKIKKKINKGQVMCHIPKFPLQPGVYSYHLFCSDLTDVYDKIEFAGYLYVESGKFYISNKLPHRSLGDFLVQNEWDLKYE